MWRDGAGKGLGPGRGTLRLIGRGRLIRPQQGGDVDRRRRFRPAGAASLRALRSSGPASAWSRITAMASAGRACSSSSRLAPVADQQTLELGMLARAELPGHRRVDQRPETVGQRRRAARPRPPPRPASGGRQAGSPPAPRTRASRPSSHEQAIAAQATATAPAPAVRLDLAGRQERLDRDRDRREDPRAGEPSLRRR